MLDSSQAVGRTAMAPMAWHCCTKLDDNAKINWVLWIVLREDACSTIAGALPPLLPVHFFAVPVLLPISLIPLPCLAHNSTLPLAASWRVPPFFLTRVANRRAGRPYPMPHWVLDLAPPVQADLHTRNRPSVCVPAFYGPSSRLTSHSPDAKGAAAEAGDCWARLPTAAGG